VEGRGERLRTTKSLIFAQCLVTADGEPCMRASGIFKIGKEMGGGGGLTQFLQGINQG
jgi:hypothetical protein